MSGCSFIGRNHLLSVGACAAAWAMLFLTLPTPLHPTDSPGATPSPCRAQNVVQVDISGCIPGGIGDMCGGTCTVRFTPICSGDGCEILDAQFPRFRCSGEAETPGACSCEELPDVRPASRQMAFCDTTATTVNGDGWSETFTTTSAN